TVLECDVRKPDEVKKAVREIIEHRGAIDVLVNNAGIIQVGPMEHMQREDFIDAMDVHFWGPLYFLQEVVPHMQRRGDGRIVTSPRSAARSPCRTCCRTSRASLRSSAFPKGSVRSSRRTASTLRPCAPVSC